MGRGNRATPIEKTMRRRGILLIALSLALAFGAQMSGISLRPVMSAGWISAAKVIGWLCCAAPVGMLLPINLVLAERYKQRWNAQDVADTQHFLLEHREQAEEFSKVGLVRVGKLRRQTNTYAVLLGLTGFAGGVCSGIAYDAAWAVLQQFLCGYGLLCAFSQIRLPAPKHLFEEDKTYISRAEYPLLYAAAERAARTLGCEGEIRIGLQGDFNGGIARIGEVYSVQLGAILLELLSEEEAYSVLLHEFGHMAEERRPEDREKAYMGFVANGRNPHALNGIVTLQYSFLDVRYAFEMFLVEYACSVLWEREADRAMAEYGDPAHAVSALLKMKYYHLHEWEEGSTDGPVFYGQQEAPLHIIEDQIAPFRKALEQRREAWNALVDCEILSRSASHPTLKMRMEAMGVTKPVLTETCESAEYRAECRKAVAYVEELVYERGKEDFKAQRMEEYLMPLARVGQWEAAGCPLIAETYGDVVRDLRSVGRVRDAMALCDRAIAELDTAASCFAYFMRGLQRLHCYDPRGIEDLYHAAEHNSNYIDEAYNTIGEFCCMTGRADALAEYRERAVRMGQQQKDIYSEINVLRKKDTLVSEQLPDELMEGLLACLREGDDGCIRQVYLVRKVVTDDYFVSAVVVQFTKQTDDRRRENCLHKIFNYLDTCSDWQFSLFDYETVKQVNFSAVKNSVIYPTREQ